MATIRQRKNADGVVHRYEIWRYQKALVTADGTSVPGGERYLTSWEAGQPWRAKLEGLLTPVEFLQLQVKLEDMMSDQIVAAEGARLRTVASELDAIRTQMDKEPWFPSTVEPSFDALRLAAQSFLDCLVPSGTEGQRVAKKKTPAKTAAPKKAAAKKAPARPPATPAVTRSVFTSASEALGLGSPR